jgi:hypothetical protein
VVETRISSSRRRKASITASFSLLVQAPVQQAHPELGEDLLLQALVLFNGGLEIQLLRLLNQGSTT